MGILIGIAVSLAWIVALAIFGEWVLPVMVGGFALFRLYGIVQGALERRAYRMTVQRLIALERASSWKEWTLPAPESYALFCGVTKVESDAFKLGLMQLIAMGVLAPDGGEASADGGGDTTLRRGPAPAGGLTGSLVPIHRLWAASAGEQVRETENQAVEAQAQEAE